MADDRDPKRQGRLIAVLECVGRRQLLSGANPRVEEAAAKAARDHEEILSAVHRLEAALLTGQEPWASPGRSSFFLFAYFRGAGNW